MDDNPGDTGDGGYPRPSDAGTPCAIIHTFRAGPRAMKSRIGDFVRLFLCLERSNLFDVFQITMALPAIPV